MIDLERVHPQLRTWREMTMVMISKLGKIPREVKGWQPIVLVNTVGKLGEKLIA